MSLGSSGGEVDAPVYPFNKLLPGTGYREGVPGLRHADVIAALNHEPEIDDIEFDESKFVSGLTTRICVLAHDVDGDPLEVALEGPETRKVEPLGPTQGDPAEGVAQCFELACQAIGRKELTARVWDLTWHDGERIRIEEWLAMEGYPNESHAELNFYVYLTDPRADVDEATLIVNQSDATHFSGTIAFPRAQFVEQHTAEDDWTQIDVRGAAAASTGDGQPEVPVVRHLITLPRGAEPQMNDVRFSIAETVGDLRLYPFQRLGGEIIPAGDPAEDAGDGGEPPSEPPLFSFDPRAYLQDAWYPENACRVERLSAVRDVTLAAVECAVGRYNPVRATLELYDEVSFEVVFEGGDKTISGVRTPFETRTQVLLDLARNRDVAVRPVSHLEDRICSGEELLILTHPDYAEAAARLTEWKLQRGILTNYFVVNDGDGPAPDTNDDIRRFVKQRYNTCQVRPSYLLLLGDALRVVPDDDSSCEARHAAASGDIPAFYQERAYREDDCYSTDFPYGQMNDDLTALGIVLPDITVGRLAVRRARQAEALVDKIIRYESGENEPWRFYYSHATIASYFECCRLGGLEGREDGRSFIRSSESLREMLIGQGLTVDRIYNTNTRHHTDYTGDPTPRYYSNGEELPYPLRPDEDYPWDGDRDDIAAAINAGRLLVIHNDHGGTTGWSDPRFLTDDLDTLTNGDRLPLVLSMNCSSGSFDYDTQGFAESMVRMPTHGALGVLAFSRMSNSGIGPATARGAIDAIWPKALPDFGDLGSHARLGDILTHARSYLASYENDPEVLWTYVRILGLLGDPSAVLWTKPPLQPGNIDEYEIRPEGLDIYYNVEGALVTVWQMTADGVRPLGRAPVENGVAQVSYLQQPLAKTPIMVSVAAPGMVSPPSLAI